MSPHTVQKNIIQTYIEYEAKNYGSQADDEQTNMKKELTPAWKEILFEV